MAEGKPNEKSINDTNKAAQDLKKSLEQILESQGDYNNLLKSALKNLRQTETAYEKIEARLASLSKGSINIKQVGQDLYRLKQKEYIEQKRLTELQYEQADATKNALKLAKERVERDIQGYKDLNKLAGENEKIDINKIDIHKEILHYLEIEGNLEAVKLYSQERQLEISKQRTNQGKEQLKTEQMVSQQMGVSGNLVASLAKKLGLGEQVYEQMVDHSRKLVQENGKVTSGLGVAKTGVNAIAQGLSNSWKSASFAGKAMMGFGAAAGVVGAALKVAAMAGNALGSAMSKTGSIIKGLSPVSSNFVSGLLGPINGMIEKIPIVGGLLSGVVSFWASILDLIIGVEDYIVKAGRQIGLSAAQAVRLNSQFAAAAANSGKLYINSKALLDSQVELSKASELNNRASQSNLETNIELSKFAGVELETRKKIYEASIVTGRSMKSVAVSIMGQVASLSKATGISFNYQAILREAASQSGRLGLMFAKYPSQLTKSLISVKALGLELKQLEAIGDGMLDFESSLSKEFEAQLLLGRDINMNKAREAFLNNDLVGAASEIAKYTGDANGFLKLNRIQQQSIADLMGMSVDGMSDFLKKQEMYVKTGTKSREELMKQIELSKTNTAEKERLVSLLGQESYQNMINLSTQEKLMESFEKIKQSLVDFLTRNNVLEKIQYYVNKFTDPKNIEGIVEKLRDLMSKIFRFVVGVTNVILDGIDNVVSLFIWNDRRQKNWDNQLKGVRSVFTDITDAISTSLSTPLKTSPTIQSAGGSSAAGDMSPRKATSGAEEKRVSVKDAVVFPGNNMVINKDPLDYTIFAKNPANLSAPSINNSTIKQIVSEAVSAVVKERPIVVHTQANLNLDGQVAARSNYTNVKNNPLIGFDKTFGQMSLNT